MKKLDGIINYGDKVICVKKSINDNRDYPLPIKKGDIKIIKGGSGKIWFVDTPAGWGAYPLENFAKIE